MIDNKTAPSNHPIMPVIANRWSPVSFSNQLVEKEKVMSLLEAARWAPSAYNEQPWQYAVGYKGDDMHSKISETLFEGNAWAKEAPVLMMGIAKTFFEHKHKPNSTHMHDTGMATMNLVLQATEMDLVTHQMSGYDGDKARELLDIPEDFIPTSVIVIGYAGEPSSDEAKQRDGAPRQRKNTEDLIWK